MTADDGKHVGGKRAVDLDRGQGAFAPLETAGADGGDVDFRAGENGGDPREKSRGVEMPEDERFERAADIDGERIDLLDLNRAAAERSGPAL